MSVADFHTGCRFIGDSLFAPGGPNRRSRPAAAVDALWLCPRCTLENVGAAATCEACESARESPVDPQSRWTGGGARSSFSAAAAGTALARSAFTGVLLARRSPLGAAVSGLVAECGRRPGSGEGPPQFLGLGQRLMDSAGMELQEADTETVCQTRAAVCLEMFPTSTVTAAAVRTAPAERRACAVCTDDFCEGDVQRTLPCFHLFHRACIDPWLRQSGCCPVCMLRVDRDGMPPC